MACISKTRSCGHEVKADLNAAKNLMVAGSCPETLNVRGAGVRRDDLRIISRLAVKRESTGEVAIRLPLTVSSSGEACSP